MKVFFWIVVVLVIVIAVVVKYKDSWFPNKTPIASSTPTRWDSILPGKWHIYQKDKNDQEYLEKETDLEISDKETFSLNVTETYYRIDAGDPIKLCVIGGGAKGNWYAQNDSNFILMADECDFKLADRSGGDFLDKVDLSCDSLKNGLMYGSVSNLDFKSRIQFLNRDTLVIIGKQYNNGYDTYCMFTREK